MDTPHIYWNGVVWCCGIASGRSPVEAYRVWHAMVNWTNSYLNEVVPKIQQVNYPIWYSHG